MLRNATQNLLSFLIFLLLIAVPSFAAIDAPHNTSRGMNCSSCHNATGLFDSPFWDPAAEPAEYNAICNSCHIQTSTDDSGGSTDTDLYPGCNCAPHVATHSSATTSDNHGTWAVLCLDCHQPHANDQKMWYKNNADQLFLAKGTVISYVPGEANATGPTSIYTYSGTIEFKSPWTAATIINKTTSERRPLFFPASNYLAASRPLLNIDEANRTIIVQGDVSPLYERSGFVQTDFAIEYGQAIQRYISGTFNDNIVTNQEVKFFDQVGAGSFAFDESGTGTDTTPNGICQVCHTNTNYWKSNGDDANHHSGENCTKACHKHINGFAHAEGASEVCIECHGHDAGILYDPDITFPYTAGLIASQGKGTSQSHSTHTETDTDDLIGPAIYCDTCHDLTDLPKFKDQDGSGGHTLAETDICNTCHSPAGTYDGINDPAIGAKTNWYSGIYNPDQSLKAGKEKWCVTCHDESAAVIDTIPAPNVAGDENGSYTYGTGWGYYKTGHGLEAGEQYPSKGGVQTLSGRPVQCNSCHDYATAHIDGESRTFDDGDVFGLDPSLYRQGYRLKLIDDQEPYRMPRPSNIGTSADQFRVCFQGGCHDSGPFTDSANMNTNLVTDGINRHTYHLLFNNQEMAAADWSGAYNSRMTCVVCHNVHGSTRLAMVRDGKLINREPGQQIWYKNDATTYIDVNTYNSPEPDDLPLSASDGTAWIGKSASNLCANCHSSWPIRTEDRTPFQDVAKAPLLGWVGTNDLISDGVAPDSAVGNSTFTFRVSYSDINNDSPSTIEVWVDLDGNGDYESNEKYAMAETDTTDTNIFNGKNYTKSLAIAKNGNDDSSVLNYRFYAHDGVLEATGAPTSNSTVTILNNAPTLVWTGEDFYLADGVKPDTGGNSDTFTFRINYMDLDNETPSIIQVWIDENDVDSYEETEKYTLIEVDGSDATTSDGKLYTLDLSLAHAGDGNLTYRFYAADTNANATGSPTQDAMLTVQAEANSPPSLQFVAAGCTVSGASPQSGSTGAGFVFTVRYVDSENEAPSIIQVWVDENDVDSYEETEKYTLIEVDSDDTTYSDGKLYTTTRALTLAGDNVLNYRFYATDGIDTATGEATSDYSVTVVDALKVRPAGGSGWYTTIQSAIDAVNGAHTVLVYDGTYNEDILFQFGSNDSNTQVRSVCGPDTTIISGSGSGTTVTFSRYSSSQIDGFQVTGGTTGITVNGTQVTINNCQVHDNNGPNGGGIYVAQSGDMPTLTLTNSEIYNNSSDRGGGVSIWRGTEAGHTISNSIIRNNTITGDSLADGGGGIHLFQVPEITISNTVIKDNASTNIYGGGGLYVSQVPDSIGAGLTVSDSIISGNTSGGHGGGVYSDLSKIKFIRSSITGNTADDMGGALAWPSAGNTISFENCILADNQAYQAGMAKLNGGTLDIVNSTIVNNRASDHSGAIYNQLATITIRNSILWGNQAATVGHIAHFNGGSITITDSIIQNDDDGDFTDAPFFTSSGTTEVSGFASENDPWFVGDGNYHIQAPSSAVDNGSAADAPALDIDGQSRPEGTADDIGADEYIPGNTAPSLSWWASEGDGVIPNSGTSGDSFEFRVSYFDPDNVAPDQIQVWVDENDDGSYEYSEKHDLKGDDRADITYTDGKLYTGSLPLPYGGDGVLNYRFYASDGPDNATGSPTNNLTVTVDI